MPAAFSFLHSCDAQGLLVERAIEVRRLCLPVMAKTKVTFRPVRKSEDDWTIVAEYPGAEGRRSQDFRAKRDNRAINFAACIASFVRVPSR
jgi:hypothetical protein